MESTRQSHKHLLNIASCCFALPPHHSLPAADSSSSSSSSLYSSSSSPRSPVMKELAEMKHKCRSAMKRFGRSTRRHSADLSYDPISYAHNFEDARSDQLPSRKFPATPGRRLTREASGGIAAACG